MSNKSTGWLNLTGVICYFLGVACLTSIILIPVAVYCFIGGSRYFTWSNMSDTELAQNKQSIKNWAIFVSIVGFPVGLVSIIPYFKIGNNPVVTDVQVDKKSEEKREESESKAGEIGIKVEEKEEPKAEHVNLTSKEETLAKLEKFKNDGLITEAEYKKAVAELNKE